MLHFIDIYRLQLGSLSERDGRYLSDFQIDIFAVYLYTEVVRCTPKWSGL